MGVQPEEDYVLSSALVFSILETYTCLVGCFAELEQWSLPLMAKQEESDSLMLPARHV